MFVILELRILSEPVLYKISEGDVDRHLSMLLDESSVLLRLSEQ